MSIRPRLPSLLLATAFAASVPHAHAAIDLIATGSLSGAFSDLSGLNYTLENGAAANLLGGMGSGLAWAGGNTFLALPDRGPNASAWNSAVDDTTSYIARFHTLTLDLKASGGALPFTLTPTLKATTLLSSATALNYGAVAPTVNGLVSGASVAGNAKQYFSGRSDNFAAGLSTNPANARIDTEAIRVSNDGKSVFIADEYGPYVYQFDRATGQRLRSYALPDTFAISTLSSSKDVEISANTANGRITNKGMEGLAITPDGKTLVGFMQSPLGQDGGDGGRYNRIVKIDIASGAVTQYAYDNAIGGKNYNSSELLALNDHQFVVLERDGKGLGDGSPGSKAAVKQLYTLDLSGATEVSGIADLRTQPGVAVKGSLFLDIKAVLNAKGISDALIPSKLEGIAFGDDVMVGGVLKHTLYLANDNDFLGAVTPNGSKLSSQYDNQFYVFAFDGNDLVKQNISAVPEPESYALMLGGLAVLAAVARRRKAA
nr:esterase-like activity of phytase family protein [uncultured Roseateles sp.]